MPATNLALVPICGYSLLEHACAAFATLLERSSLVNSLIGLLRGNDGIEFLFAKKTED